MARSNAITKPCEACGADFQAKAADIARGWGRFCCKSCKANKPNGSSPVNEISELARLAKRLEDGLEYSGEIPIREVITEVSAKIRTLAKCQDEPMRVHVEDLATRNGWKKEDGEGAIEFLMRKAYATGRDDTLAAPPTSSQLERARRAYSSATGLGTSKNGMFAALKASREQQDGQG